MQSKIPFRSWRYLAQAATHTNLFSRADRSDRLGKRQKAKGNRQGFCRLCLNPSVVLQLEIGVSSSKPTTTGSGLGLAIVRQIVVAHGSTVTANNHSQTGGAWIQISLTSEKLTETEILELSVSRCAIDRGFAVALFEPDVTMLVLGLLLESA